MHSDCLLVFSTGRGVSRYAELVAEAPLPTPDVLILGVGTEIWHRNAPETPSCACTQCAPKEQTTECEFVPGYMLDAGWVDHLKIGWDHQIAATVARTFADLTPQTPAKSRPTLFKLSYDYVRGTAVGTEAARIVTDLSSSLHAAGVMAKVVLSGPGDLDILPQAAGKGQALRHLLESRGGLKTPCGEIVPGRLGLGPGCVAICAGDSGNDADLFNVPGVKGIAVANAHAELRHFLDGRPDLGAFRAGKPCAAGVIEGLRHYGLLPPSAAQKNSPGAA